MGRYFASPRTFIAALISFWTLGALAQTTESATFEDWQADFNGENLWFASPVVFPPAPYLAFSCYKGLLCGFFMVEEGTLPEGWQSPDTPVLVTVDEKPAMETSGNAFLSASGAEEITKDFAHQTLAMLKAMEGGKTLRVSIGDVEFVQPIAGFYDASMWALGKFAFAFAESQPVRKFGDWTAHIVRGLDGIENESVRVVGRRQASMQGWPDRNDALRGQSRRTDLGKARHQGGRRHQFDDFRRLSQPRSRLHFTENHGTGGPIGESGKARRQGDHHSRRRDDNLLSHPNEGI